MGRELSVFRRLEKIEKEIGYCGIKLEREQRLRLQLELMRRHRKGLARVIESETELLASDLDGRTIEGASLLEVSRQCRFGEFDGSEEHDEGLIERARETFVRSGSHPALLSERTFIDREIELYCERLEAYPAFHQKLASLIQERDGFLDSHQLDRSTEIRQMTIRFESIEERWNHTTEDRGNLDVAVERAESAICYLRSAIEFLRESRSSFDIDPWIRGGYLLDLFKHSGIGRAREMVEGADRNSKLVVREIVCLDERGFSLEGFGSVLPNFLGALFHDLFENRRIDSSMDIVADKLATLEVARDAIVERRDQVVELQESLDEERGRLFQEIGDGRRRLSASA